ncbi:hypothetical protein BH23GEM3_BH23GEM3_02620 [soil metagenome]
MPPPARDPRIRAAEQALHELGISGSAEIGGHEGEILVLQVAHHAWEGLLDEEAIRVADRMKALGFRYVALDFAPN